MTAVRILSGLKEEIMQREYLEGQIFGKWQVIRYNGCPDQKKSYYDCMCMGCGKVYKVRSDKMKDGTSTQCTACARKGRKK